MFCLLFLFFPSRKESLFNLPAPRALGRSEGGLLGEINPDRSIFPKKKKKNIKEEEKEEKENCEDGLFFRLLYLRKTSAQERGALLKRRGQIRCSAPKYSK